MKKHELQAKIKDKFKFQKDAATALGITEGTLSDNLNEPTEEFLNRLKGIGVDVNIKEDSVIHIYPNKYPIIKEIDAGEPKVIYRAENILGEINLDYQKVDNCFCVKVVGDSMSTPDGNSINDGDIILVDMDMPYYNGDVIVISLENGKREMVKRFERRDNQIFLHSDNPKYKTIPIELSDQETIIIFKVVLVQPKPRKL